MSENTNSHILVHRFDYYEPATLTEAIKLLVEHHGQVKILAGGTDLFVHMKMERATPQAVINIGRIAGLDRIEVSDDHLYLGALSTIRTIEMLSLVQAHFQALSEACTNFSSTQVQTMGTIGGNLGNASPAADSAPALIALAAEIELAGPEGKRCIPVEQFFRGPGKSDLRPGELVTQVILPRPRTGTGSAFQKISRVSNDISKASCAVVIVRDNDRVVDCRLAFGSVAPTPIRAPKAEQVLIGKVWSQELVAQAAQLAAQEIAPIDDTRSTAWYRRDVVCVMAEDGLQRAWQRAGNTPAAPKTWAVPAVTPAAGPSVSLRLGADEKRQVELKVNGEKHAVWVSPNDLLLNVLRDDLHLTGTKYGCGIGECSACTVLMDGKPVLSCLVLAVSAEGHDIVTIEGLAGPDGQLDPLQEAFLDFSAYQCGYCTPGMLMTAKSLLTEKPNPSEDDVRHYMRGNMCRCTGYVSIVRAVLSAAEQTSK